MKKSMIATAVVATAGLAASANAGYFVVNNASYTPAGGTGNPNITISGDLGTGGLSDVGLGAYDFTQGSSAAAGSTYTISDAQATSIGSAIGANVSGGLQNGTLYYFGFEASASGPGYFGYLFVGDGGGMSYNVSNASNASQGVVTNMNVNNWVGGGDTYDGYESVTTGGQAYVAIFAGLSVGTQIGGSTQSDTNFNVRYLSFDGSNWNVAGSADSASSSSLNTALYAVPVPAPALLAGAGLVGAAALRRRMAKKA